MRQCCCCPEEIPGCHFHCFPLTLHLDFPSKLRKLGGADREGKGECKCPSGEVRPQLSAYGKESEWSKAVCVKGVRWAVGQALGRKEGGLAG